ncbi:hypothetical protein KUTeg_020379 [Tegillarca granosa]|uniref:Uncharacterized protein n=1 Tax=Tegillarca granosa TaxID=220873 RepID=A0ABQ9ECV4_TEGGR|nr:hypothetical protein KUTeg_020379 [Tegillarca granosa]
MDNVSLCSNSVTPRDSIADSSIVSNTFLTLRDCSTPCNNEKDDVSKLKQKSMNMLLPINSKNFLKPKRNYNLGKSPAALVVPLKIENTYRIEPSIMFKSRATEIQEVVKNILEIHLKKMKYSPESSGEVARNLSTIVKNKLKELIPPRYKIICQTFIGQKRGQGLEIATRCLWCPSTDSYEVVNFKNDSIIATVIIHGVYFE